MLHHIRIETTAGRCYLRGKTSLRLTSLLEGGGGTESLLETGHVLKQLKLESMSVIQLTCDHEEDVDV